MQDPDRDGDFEARHRYLARLEVEHDNFRALLGVAAHARRRRDGAGERTIRMLDLTARLRRTAVPSPGLLHRGSALVRAGAGCHHAARGRVGRRRRDRAGVDPRDLRGTGGRRRPSWSTRTACSRQRFLTSGSRGQLERLRSVLLIGQAMAAHTMGQTEKARELYEKGLATFRDPLRRGHLLHNYAAMIGATEGPAMALEYERETAELFRQAGDENMSGVREPQRGLQPPRARTSRGGPAGDGGTVPRVVATRIPEALFVVAEDYASVMSDLGRFAETALLIGAATAMRERIGVPVDPPQELELEEPVGRARAALGDEWHVVGAVAA